MISGFHSKVAENFALLGYYAANSGSTTTCCIITQNSTVLIILPVFDLSQSGNYIG